MQSKVPAASGQSNKDTSLLFKSGRAATGTSVPGHFMLQATTAHVSWGKVPPSPVSPVICPALGPWHPDMGLQHPNPNPEHLNKQREGSCQGTRGCCQHRRQRRAEKGESPAG